MTDHQLLHLFVSGSLGWTIYKNYEAIRSNRAYTSLLELIITGLEGVQVRISNLEASTILNSSSTPEILRYIQTDSQAVKKWLKNNANPGLLHTYLAPCVAALLASLSYVLFQRWMGFSP